MSKVRVATVWFSGCAGCHMSFLDLDERLIDLRDRVELVYSPVVDAKEIPEGIDVALIEGAINTPEQLEHLREIREKAKILVALGDCATTGNVPSMRNPIPRDEVIRTVYGETDPPGLEDGEVPPLLPQALPLHAYVRVDYYIPGCPPDADRIWKFLTTLLKEGKPRLEGEEIRFG
ncbi:NADH-quinone oxidoreductase subunit B family protein [Candidatus Bipolaricaulota sp. J31]